jgi:SAM-dependent methyltransferase
MTRSFRDPSGSCWLAQERVFRVLDQPSALTLEAFLRTSAAQTFTESGRLVSSRHLTESEAAAACDLVGFRPEPGQSAGHAVFEHERVRLPSYPYEWPPEMLWAAGKLTLDLAASALQEGYCLKDATPYNVLFRGPTAVFIDMPSFEARAPGDPVWTPYGQFVRTFLLPLLASREWGLSLADIFTTHRDGLEPQEVYRFCGPLQRLRPSMLSLVSIPTWLRPRAQAQGRKLYEPRATADPEKARFILESLLSRAQRSLDSLRPKAVRNSTWSEYMTTHSYNEPAFAAKERFVAEFLQETKPGRVLDAGANTGHFSALAARAGAQVVAVDLDPACVGAIWARAVTDKLDILPLVINLSRPSPPLGWRNAECPSFLHRARGGFDCVLMLALIHHLLVTERIPLQEIIALAADLTTSTAIIELVLPQDPMFQQLSRGRDHLHTGLDQPAFERACGVHFDVVRSLPMPGAHRRLYALKRKDATQT